MEKFQYDIAISFAGEDREIANELAKRLKAKKVHVFYDEFEQDKLWGKDLYEYLAGIYSDHARFCLMLVSKDYSKKLWTTHERKNAQSRAFKENKEYILPLRVDDTKIPGLVDTVGYIDLRTVSLNTVVDLILKKLNFKEEAFSDLMAGIKPTSFSENQIKKLAHSIVSEYADLSIGQDLLVEDRSKEAIDVFYKIAIQFDAFGIGSLGIGGLVRIGRGAIPKLIDLLLSENPLISYVTLDEITELENRIYTDSINYVKFIEELTSHPKWNSVSQRLTKLSTAQELDDIQRKFVINETKILNFYCGL